MDSILSAVGSLVDLTIDGVGAFATAITSSPIILCFVVVGLVFLGLNAVRKLMRV